MIYLESYKVGKVIKSYNKWVKDMGHYYGDERLSQVAWTNLTKLFRSYKMMIGDTKDVGRILDFGCGNGFLLDYLNENNIKYEYLGVDIRKEVIEEAKKHYPDEEFLVIKKIKDVPKNYYDLVFAHGVFTTQMDENDILEFVNYFIGSKKIVFSFLPTSVNKGITYSYDIYTYYNPLNLKLFLKDNIKNGSFSIHMIDRSESFITWEK
jgi:SAM-dependent methyltransferase